MQYVTFHTGGFYEDVFNTHLKPSAEKFNLNLRVYREHNHQDWTLNTRLKAKVLLRALQEYPEVVWLDVDSEIVRSPDLFDKIPGVFEVGVFYLDWFKHWRNEEGKGKEELVNSVMFLRRTPGVLSLIESWITANTGTSCYEQLIFQQELEKRQDIGVFRLPAEYCAIVNHQDIAPEYIAEPRIIQHQCSRAVKRNSKLLKI